MTGDDGARERERLEQDSFDIGVQLGVVINAARALDMTMLEAMVRAADRFDTVESMLNPTSWIQHNAKVTNMGEAARIVMAFRKAIAAMDARQHP